MHTMKRNLFTLAALLLSPLAALPAAELPTAKPQARVTINSKGTASITT
jgi:hypothetical protein